MADASSAYITPPTVYMPDTGLRFSLISTDEEWIKETGESLEKDFRSKLTFYHIEKPETSDDITWQLLYLPYSDFVLVDTANMTLAQGMFCTANLEKLNIWWNITDNTNNALQSLLLALDARFYDDIDVFIETVRAEVNG